MFNPTKFKSMESYRPKFLEYAFEGCISINFQIPKIKKKKSSFASDVYVCGIRGKKGCFSVRELPSGDLDVAIYEEAPEDVEPRDTYYHTLEDSPGWGFKAWALVHRLMNE